MTISFKAKKTISLSHKYRPPSKTQWANTRRKGGCQVEERDTSVYLLGCLAQSLPIRMGSNDQ
jgi:hypothetical protein